MNVTACIRRLLSQRAMLGACRSYHDPAQREFLSSMKGGAVLLDKDDSSGIATLTVDHQERKNALSGDMMVQLADSVTELESWSAGKGLVLLGAGQTFCSGGDLTLMRSIADPVKGGNMCAFMQDTLNRMFKLPLVSLALVQGRALGGGAELSTACDFRLMEAGAKIGWVQGRMGVSPGWGGGVRLVQLVGRTKALELLASSRIFSAEDAVELGLANMVLPSGGDILQEAKTWLRARMQGEPAVVQAAKRVVVNAHNTDSSRVLECEREIFMSVWGGAAHQAAMEGNIKHN